MPGRWLHKLASLILVTVGLSQGTDRVQADARADKPPRPNVILILADDYGTPGVGCYGGVYKTPNLDALAADGLRFTHAYSMPLCAPTRGVIMSGRYPFRNGVRDNGAGAAYKPSDSPSIAKTLQTAGYATAVAGKWRQLSYFKTVEDAQAWGFDEFMIWGVGDTVKGERYWQPAYNHNGKPVDAGDKYGPDLLHDFVVDFITRNREKPFFIYYPTPLVHSPILHTPDSKNEKGGSHYQDNVEYLDKQVGKLAAELDRLKLRENTLLVFVGDNGSTGGGSHKVHDKGVDGSKGSMLEGGSNVPLIVNWKGTTSAKVLDEPVDVSDFYATFAELAGAKLPEDVKFDGRSFVPQLHGQKGNPREWAFIQLGNAWFARSREWKLDRSGTLFSMKNAPYEQTPIAADSTDPAAAAARKQLQAALDELNPTGGKTSGDGAQPKKKARPAAKAAS